MEEEEVYASAIVGDFTIELKGEKLYVDGIHVATKKGESDKKKKRTSHAEARGNSIAIAGSTVGGADVAAAIASRMKKKK